jgi:hypothetical protein
MHKCLLSLFATVFVSSAVSAADGANSPGVSVADVGGARTGGSVAYLKNDKGVVIELHSQTDGMHITLRQS